MPGYTLLARNLQVVLLYDMGYGHYLYYPYTLTDILSVMTVYQSTMMKHSNRTLTPLITLSTSLKGLLAFHKIFS